MSGHGGGEVEVEDQPKRRLWRGGEQRNSRYPKALPMWGAALGLWCWETGCVAGERR